MILSEQIRAARVLLGWNQEELSIRAKVGIATIKRIEAKRGPVSGVADTLWKIQRAFEASGVVFIDSDRTGGPGIRLAEPYSEGAPKSPTS